MAALSSISALELQEGQSITIHYKGLDGKIRAIHELSMTKGQIVIVQMVGESFPVTVGTWKDRSRLDMNPNE